MNVVSKLKWFYPGMRIKRWLMFLPIGLLFIIIGNVLFVNWRIDGLLRRLGKYAFEIFGINVGNQTELVIIGSVFLILGFIIIYFVMRQILYSVVNTITGSKSNIADIVYQRRFLVNGPRIVVVGGGTGLSTMLRGLKQYTSNITAIVTVTDDGGSSGRLRNEMGILPPGDIRNCLVALADTEEHMEELLQYRFEDGNEGIKGHSFGNLMLGALTNLTGDFESAIAKLSSILAIRGKVYPSSKTPIELVAEFEDGAVLTGETNIASYGKPIKKMSLSNEDAKPPQDAVDAIYKADIIILGPGSLYTSVIPNLLVKDIKDAIEKSRAIKVYVCNVMTQPGETNGFSASDHCYLVSSYLKDKTIKYALINNIKPDKSILDKYENQGQIFVEPDVINLKPLSLNVILGDFMQSDNLVRHDYNKLAEKIMTILE